MTEATQKPRRSRVPRVVIGRGGGELPAPLPGVIDGALTWEVNQDPLHPRTNPAAKQMHVPLGEQICPDCDGDHGATIRTHELTHVRIEPHKTPEQIMKMRMAKGVHPDALAAVHEAAVGQIMARNGLYPDRDDPGLCVKGRRKIEAGLLQRRRFLEIAGYVGSVGPQFGFATATYDEYDPVTRITTRKKVNADPLFAEALRAMRDIYLAIANERGTIPSRKTLVDYARWLTERGAKADAHEAERRGGSTASREGEGEGKEGVHRPMHRGGGELREGDGTRKQVRTLMDRLGDKPLNDDLWGIMTIEPLRLHHSIAPPRVVLKNRAAEEGARPSFMSRYCVDQRVFARRKRKEGGSILVDCSGSMSWPYDQLMALIDENPAATVAFYSGDHDDERGTLRVVVKNRKRVERGLFSPPAEGGNAIDGPALRWLAEQPGPRIWVSDGGVTGRGAGKRLHEDACRIQAKYRIRRVMTFTDAAEALRDPRIGDLTTGVDLNYLTT